VNRSRYGVGALIRSQVYQYLRAVGVTCAFSFYTAFSSASTPTNKLLSQLIAIPKWNTASLCH